MVNDSDRNSEYALENNAMVTRRQFLFHMSVTGAGTSLIANTALGQLSTLKPRALNIPNPLQNYPNRWWEKVYRDLYKSDSTFTFLCAPNDTHNCLLNAHVKNGVVTRISPTYKYHQATDLDGNRASQRWDPRCCQKGLALVRRIYGDRRPKRPMMREGFKRWIEDGMPRDPQTGAVDADRYLQRGRDNWVPVSWDFAFQYAGKAMLNIAQTYNGDEGKRRLLAQGYDPAMVETTEGIGTRTLKFRGGMPPLGMTRIFAQYRLANVMALMDAKIRGVGPEEAQAATGWDNFSWHTDLPPGHPMVTGQQASDFDLCSVEHAKLVIAWGMNWITTKMPESHWLCEARMKGTKVVVIAAEYSATMNKADEGFIVRPGTTPALALGLAQVLIEENLYDAAYVKANTDLPLLTRMDTGKRLRADEVFANYQPPTLRNNTTITNNKESGPEIHKQAGPVISQDKRLEWGDYVMWDETSGKPIAVNRDQISEHFNKLNIDPKLQGAVNVTLKDGTVVECRTVFDVTKQMLDSSYRPEQVEKISWAKADAIRSLARQIAHHTGQTLFVMGMGPNQYFNSDLKDRATFLVACLTRNIGRLGGNIGSFSGNYRGSYFNGLKQYIAENPFDIERDPAKPARVKQYWRGESVHYFNHGDTILRMGDHILTGKSHMPVPTKSICHSNSNSLIGNAKGHYDTVVNTLRKVEFVCINEWWWTGSCEYVDIVFPVDSWAEMKFPDMTISVTNPFLYTFPSTPLPRIHDTKGDVEVAAGISSAIGKLIGEPRMVNYWKFVHEGQMRPYIQRILDHSNDTRGYRIEDLEAKASQGIPAILQSRTYPKMSGWEQVHEHKPWYTKSGRLEFYREESEFMDSGENMVIHREPIDSTFYEPNVIVADANHPLLRPRSPEYYGVDRRKLDGDTRQARHVILNVDQLLGTQHPLTSLGHGYIFHTPKYRHGAHTTPTDTDIIAVWFGPFGDIHRNDKRMPFINEAYFDINPLDARKLGIEDGDYVYIDADPKDRPFHHWQDHPEWYKVCRLLCRARYYPGTPRGVTRMWHNMYGATFGSVAAAAKSPIGLAKTENTNYQALFRSGSHQSCTRSFIKPTWMTDSLTVKDLFGQQITQGFVVDVHCPTGAPRESFVKITRAESGGINGEKLWRPAQIGMRPGYESETLKNFIRGQYISIT